jgi:anthranilate synthase component 1
MQIIRELEKQARRAYTGSLGYINHDGSMDFNVLIRSFMQQQTQLYFRAGGGIVADSDSNKELQETRHKAHGLLKTLGVTL